jgi:alkanesulfonate monooxygenase SsuD/methylene tetrahydromethanopterin reductase-like flavin-dependent oxidoreductase (luciferase family)
MTLMDYSFQNPKDKSATKRKLDYWINMAKLLERGGINALFLADTYGGYDTYEGSLDNCIRRAAQWPMTDPTIVSETDDVTLARSG